MKQGPRIAWFAVLCGAMVVILLVAFDVIPPTGLPDGAIVVPRDVPTLEDALAAVSRGGTIVLQHRGEEYAGPFRIGVPDVTLLGRRGVVLVGTDGEPAIAIDADGVTLSTLEISADGVGLRVQGAECRVEDIVVRSDSIGVQLTGARRCTLERVDVVGGRIGMELVSSSGNRLVDLTVDGASQVGLKLLQSKGNACDRFSVVGANVGVSLDQDSSGNRLASGSIDRSAERGIEIHISGDNEVVDCRIVDAGIGIALETVTGNAVAGCTMERLTDAGISLRQSAQNRIERCEIAEIGGSGLLLSQSHENLISTCVIETCTVGAIELRESDRNLIVENRLERSRTGVLLDGSENRIMRNRIAASSSVGSLVTGGRGNRFLDNEVRGAELGLVLVNSAEAVVLRNHLVEQSVCSIAVVDGSSAGSVTENRIERSSIGLLAAGISRTDFLDNDLLGSETGFLLMPSHAGVWIEGNRLEKNRIGLRAVGGEFEDVRSALAGVGIDLEAIEEPSAAVILNNSFSRSREADLANDADRPLLAGGNWWNGSSDGATVVGDVRLEESAWKGTVAVGTGKGAAYVLLGRILQVVLESSGYRVIDLIGLESGERAADALRAHDVDVIWWASGVDLPGFLGETGAVALPIPAVDGWTAIATGPIAGNLPEPTLSSLVEFTAASDMSLRVAVPRSFGEERMARFIDVYGLAGAIVGITWAETTGEAETMAKFGAADLVIAGILDETLTLSGFAPIEDDRDALESWHLALVVQEDMQARCPGVEEIVRPELAKLTTEELHDLNSRVRLLDRDPADVALEFVEGSRSSE